MSGVFVPQDGQEGVRVLSLAETAQGLDLGALEGVGLALSALSKDPGVKGTVLHLRGAAPLGLAMADVIGELAWAIESCPKPVVACLEGVIGGAIWALALAAHYRFAASDVQIILPEARFGLMPAAGTTQRLPRLIGAAQTIRMMLGAQAETAEDLLALGALDRVGEGAGQDAAAEALRLGMAPRRTRDEVAGLRDAKRYLTEVRAFQDRVTDDPLDVSRAVVKCVEGALLLPFARGLALEAVSLQDLGQAPQTRAVRHAAASERAARAALRAMAQQVSAAPTPPVRRIGIWRPGAAQAEVVLAALSRGITVVVVDPDRLAMTAFLGQVAALQEARVAQNEMTTETRDADWSRLQTAAEEALEGCDVILAAAAGARQGMVPLLALGGWGQGLRLWPGGVFGGHAELALGEGQVGVAEAMDLARQLGWRLQITGRGGFIAPHLAQARQAAVARLAELGHAPADIAAGLGLVGLGPGATARQKPKGAAVDDLGHLAMAALANEAMRRLDEGAAGTEQEVDAAALACGLLARWAGGPLYQADQRGLILLRADLMRLGGAGRLVPCALLNRMIEQGTRLYPQA